MGDKTKGLYGKFIVQRADGSDQHGGKHHGCEYFVLDLSHDKHAYMALRAYANSCREEYPLLAADLLEKSKVMRAAGLFPTFSPELREAVQKALAAGKSCAEHQGAIVFINDGKAEDRWAEHEANACPACGGSGHKDDAAPFVQWSEMLLRAMQTISKMTGDAGFNIGGPIEYCDAANDPEAAKELLIAATEYLKGISKLSGEAIARAQSPARTAVPATANFPHDDMGAEVPA